MLGTSQDTQLHRDAWTWRRIPGIPPSSIGMCGAGGGSLGFHQGAQLCREGCSWRGVTGVRWGVQLQGDMGSLSLATARHLDMRIFKW